MSDNSKDAASIILRDIRGTRRTAAEFARELGVHQNTVLNWEAGNHPVHWQHLAKILMMANPVERGQLIQALASRNK